MQVAYVLYWWLALIAVGFVSFPLTSRICSSLADKGYSISRIIGLTFLTFISWMLSSLHILPFGYANIGVSILILVAVSFFFGKKNLKISEWPRKKILISELVFTVAFILFLLIRMGKPDIYYHGFADAVFNHAFVESILRGGYAPPIDPWYAGESVPYYYGGHYVVALLTKFTGVPTAIAFNIAIAMFASLAACACYGLGYNITKRKLYGLLAVLFVCIAGYTSGAFQLVANATNHTVLGYPPIGAKNVVDWMSSFDFGATWLVNGAIVQYPYYSFMTGDMHSFFMSIPFQITYITLIFAVFQKSRSDVSSSRSDTLLDIAILSVCLGFFFILNTWEFPTYVIFTFAAFIILKIRPSIRENLFMPLFIAALGFTLYLPYYLSGRMSGFNGFGLLPSGIRTSLAQFLEYGVLFLFILITFVLMLWKREFLAGKRAIVVSVALFIPIVLIAVFLHFQILVIVVPIGLLCLYFLYKSKAKTEREFILLLILMGVALAFFCDFMYIKDALSGQWVRFNTVMKLYHPLWIFLGLAATYGVYYVLQHLNAKRKLIRIGKAAWIGIVALLIIVSLIHPVASTVSMTSGRHNDVCGFNRGTLDGMAYIEGVNKGDFEAIKWINENIKGSPVILEMPGNLATYSSRVSAFTGLPTVIGWGTWEVMWRTGGQNVSERNNDVDLIYNTADNNKALELLKKEPYNVEYIYVGSLERDKYTAEGLQKFDTFKNDYHLIYQNEGVNIYQLKGD